MKSPVNVENGQVVQGQVFYYAIINENTVKSGPHGVEFLRIFETTGLLNCLYYTGN